MKNKIDDDIGDIYVSRWLRLWVSIFLELIDHIEFLSTDIHVQCPTVALICSVTDTGCNMASWCCIIVRFKQSYLPDVQLCTTLASQHFTHRGAHACA